MMEETTVLYLQGYIQARLSACCFNKTLPHEAVTECDSSCSCRILLQLAIQLKGLIQILMGKCLNQGSHGSGVGKDCTLVPGQEYFL